MMLKYNLITIASENMGIGYESLPFHLPNIEEICGKFCSETKDKTKKNLMVLGRKSWDAWDSVSETKTPFFGLINFVLTSRNDFDVSEYPDVYVFNSWEEINAKLENTEFKKVYETIWIGGGTALYDYAQKSQHFYRMYIMKVKKFYEADTFFPKIVDNVRRIDDDRIPKGIQFDDGVEWEFEAWENSYLPETQHQ